MTVAISTSVHQPNTLAEAIARRRQGFSLEQVFYTSPNVFQRDMEAIYRKHWLFAGHVSRIPNAGDYLLYEVAGDSVVVIRDDDGSVKALLNVCRHRGARICQTEHGHCTKLVCPYHSWTFNKDGELFSCRDMAADFNKSQFPLHRLHSRVVEGLIYVCFAKEPLDFEPIGRDIVPFLKPHQIANTKIAHHHRYLVNANWKLVIENFQECYHCAPAHPEYCRVMSWVTTLSSGAKSQTAETFRAYVEEWKAKPNRHFPKFVDATIDTIHECSRTIIGPGKVSQSMGGKPVSRLLGEYTEYDGATTTVRVLTSWVASANDYAMVIRCTPLEAQLTEMDCNWMVHAEAREGIDYNIDELTWLWKTTYGQDVMLAENNQRGVNTYSYVPGPYAQTESGTSLFVDWYLKQLRTHLDDESID
jgi:Rieske 2Fe-2S family protein